MDIVRAHLPDTTIAIVDPVGFNIVTLEGPNRARGASLAIYRFLEIENWATYPSQVYEQIETPFDTMFQYYGDQPVIHAVGPYLRDERYKGDTPDSMLFCRALSIPGRPQQICSNRQLPETFV